jgi:hypothetical protein
MIYPFLQNCIDYLFFFLAEETRGELIYQLHFWGLLAIIMYVSLYGSKRATELFLVYGLVVIFLFYLFKGCFLTRLEKHYRKKDETIVDGFLRTIRMPVNKETRYTATVGGFTIIYGMILLYYLRLFHLN